MHDIRPLHFKFFFYCLPTRSCGILFVIHLLHAWLYSCCRKKTNYFNVFLSVDPCSQSYFFCWSSWSWLQQIQKSISQFDPCSWRYSNCALHNDSHWHHGKKYCEVQITSFLRLCCFGWMCVYFFSKGKSSVENSAERDSRTTVQAVNFISF